MKSVFTDASEVKRVLCNPQSVLAALGLLDGAKRQQHGFLICCPWHNERSPSCSVRVGPDGTVAAHCFACGHSGDVYHLLAAVWGLDVHRDFARIVEEAAALYGQSAAAPPLCRPSRRTPPPHAEVTAFWDRCRLVCDDRGLCLDLFGRALDPAIVADRDLARTLPLDGPLPRWAWNSGKSWRDSGHKLIVPLYDAAGALCSVHARSLQPDASPKGLSPAGYSSTGLVMCCPFARALLAKGVPAWWPQSQPPAVIVCEGVPDFLTDASHFGEWEYAPATLGVISGAWSQAVAASVPAGCRVVIRTHSDDAGMKYRRQIAESLYERCHVEVLHV